jgi:hypothetical protein
MLGSRWTLVTGLLIPAAAVLVGIPITAQSTATVWGMPLVFAWIFAWLPLTTLCLWLSWSRFDNAVYARVEGGDAS